MSKFSDFYAKVMEDDALKAEVVKVLGGSTFDNATDDQLAKIGDIAKGAGFDFTLEEVKAHFEESELDDDDLDAVAGGNKAYKEVDPSKIKIDPIYLNRVSL